MFTKILIANRGEIACRVIKTARRMGIATVAVYSEADRDALHVELADESGVHRRGRQSRVLSVDRQGHRRLQGDRRAGGAPRLRFPFGRTKLSARRVEADGIVFIGPKHAAIAAMGDKIASKKLAAEAKVSTIPGHNAAIATADEAVAIARRVGYPVMIKASAGGGGKGLRVAWDDRQASEGFEVVPQRGAGELRRRPRLHREVRRGTAPHRDPGARRRAWALRLARRARVLDPAPAPEGNRGKRRALSSTRRRARRWASRRVTLAKAVGYQSAGTVEFVVGQGQALLFPRDEHPPAGRAPGDGVRDRPRSRRADDPRRGRRAARLHAGRRAPRRLGDGVPHQCRRSAARLSAQHGPPRHVPAADADALRRLARAVRRRGACRQRRRRRAARSRSTTTR